MSRKESLNPHRRVHLKVKSFGGCPFFYFVCLVYFVRDKVWSIIDELKSNNRKKVMILMAENRSNWLFSQK